MRNGCILVHKRISTHIVLIYVLIQALILCRLYFLVDVLVYLVVGMMDLCICIGIFIRFLGNIHIVGWVWSKK